MRKNWIYTGLVILLLAAGCGPSQEEKASVRLKQARILLEQHDTTGALLHIDSMRMLYPKATYALNGAQNLKREIHWAVYQRKQLELDSTEAGIARFMPLFIAGKGEFERVVTYTHRKQVAEENLSRSYLRAEVTENGDLVLVSQYFGNHPVGHTSVKVYEGDLEAYTDTVIGEDNGNFQGGFLGARWERVTFRKEVNRKVAALIADNPGKRFRILFSGAGKYVIFLEPKDEVAIRDAYRLSVLIKKRQQLEEEINRLDIR